MRNNKLRLLVPVLALLSLLLAACGSTPEANFPTGKFVRADNANHGFIFNEDGTWIVFDGSSTLVRATYSVEGDVMTEESNDSGCTAVPMKFKYTYDGTNLTFNYVDDPDDDWCSGRRNDMNNVTYVPSP
jgi:hypothetical protein